MHYERFNDGTVKCIEDEIPFELPEGWAWCRVRNIAIVKGGKRLPKGASFSEKKTSHAYIRVTDMKNHSININDLRYISEDIFLTIKNYTIAKDDLYVTIAGTIGVVGEVPDLLDGMNITENAVKITNIAINKSFLCIVLQTELVQQQFKDKTHQVAMPKLALERILSTLIPICPSAQQTKIVDKIQICDKFLSTINVEKDELQKILALSKSKILDLAIRGKLVPQNPNDEPASVLLERIREEKEELIKQGKIKRNKKESVIFKGDDNSYYQDLPENWIKIRLSSISEIITKGTTPRGGRIAYSQSGIGFLRAENIAGYDKLNLSNLNYIDEESHNNYLKRSILKENDILITIAGTLGRTGIVPQQALPLNTNQAVAIIRLVDKNIINVKYLVYAINSPQIKDDLLDKSVDVAIPNLSLENIADCNIPFPPFAEQKRIVTAIEEAFSKLDKISESLA